MTDVPAVEARGLAKRYRGRAGADPVQALHGLDLVVPRGAVVGLLGPNGSGKSTTLRLLLGLHSPTAGEARVLGFPAGHREARRRTGYMPEEADLHPFLSARECVETAGALHGMARGARRAAAAALLERVGLAAEADRRVEGFSRGMKRRVGLAAALVHGPELLVLDEPTAGLDPVGRDGLLSLLEECRGRGATVLLSSHVLSDVERLCDRVAILGSGRLAAEGSMAEVLERGGAVTLEIEGGPAAADAAARAAEAAGGGGGGAAPPPPPPPPAGGQPPPPGAAARGGGGGGGPPPGGPGGPPPPPPAGGGGGGGGGGRVADRRPTREPLERVFLRLLGKDRGSPGDRAP